MNNIVQFGGHQAKYGHLSKTERQAAVVADKRSVIWSTIIRRDVAKVSTLHVHGKHHLSSNSI